MLENETISDRFWYLHEALQYDTQEKEIFKDCDRMLINQERASLWQNAQDSNIEVKKVSAIIEAKITEIHQLIKQYNWQPKKKEDEFKRNRSK
jgi:hypothetical protein